MPDQTSTVGMIRKLAAIFSTDVAGYSRLMGEDEEATIRTLTVYRALIFSLIQHYRGRVVDAPGDNLLAEFAIALEPLAHPRATLRRPPTGCGSPRRVQLAAFSFALSCDDYRWILMTNSYKNNHSQSVISPSLDSPSLSSTLQVLLRKIDVPEETALLAAVLVAVLRSPHRATRRVINEPWG